jgi:hypothetical protein
MTINIQYLFVKSVELFVSNRAMIDTIDVNVEYLQRRAITLLIRNNKIYIASVGAGVNPVHLRWKSPFAVNFNLSTATETQICC